MFEELFKLIKSIYSTNDSIYLHEPFFNGNEKKYIDECIETRMVSSIGSFVNIFEEKVTSFLGVKHGVATSNGTSALHISLILVGVQTDDEVITQSLTFVGTCNPIVYLGANPIFIDVDKDTLGLSPDKLKNFLDSKCEIRNDGYCWNKQTNRKIKACVPVHVNGFSNRIDEIIQICSSYNIEVVEDGAESLGSSFKNKYLGSYGKINALSFNGNKIITTGGGGMILTDDDQLAAKAKHITTQSKINHSWEFNHDQIGYNYRLPNINAAIGCAQIESIKNILIDKKNTAEIYSQFFEHSDIKFIHGIESSEPNFWLNTIILKDKDQKKELLIESNNKNIYLRPLWIPMHRLKIYKNFQHEDMKNTNWLYDRCISLPSSFKG